MEIQQDNARHHIEPIEYKFLQATFEVNLNVELVFPPSNSPDWNVLDLGYFNLIRSLQYKSKPKNVQELVGVVGRNFDAFLTLHKSWKQSLCAIQKLMSKCHIFAKKNREQDKVLDSVKEKLYHDKIAWSFVYVLF